MSDPTGPRRERPAPSAAVNRALRLLPLWAFLLSLGLSLIGIARPSYWFDEAATVTMAPRSLADQLRVAEQTDAVHTLFYAVMHPWVSTFGVSEWSTRVLPALVFACAAGSFALLLVRLRTPFVAVFGSLLFVILPGIAWAGREARAYAFILALAVWSLLLLDALLRGRGAFSQRWVRGLAWVGYAAMIVLMIGFSVLTAPIVIGHLVFVLIVKRRVLVPFALAWFGAAVITTPLVLRSAAQSAQVDWIDNSLLNVAMKVALGQMFWGPRFNDGLSPAMVSAVLLMLVCAALAVIAVVTAARSRIPGEGELAEPWSSGQPAPTLTSAQAVWFGLISFAGPTLVLAAATVAGMDVYQERYVLYAGLGFCLLGAEGFAALSGKRAALITIAVLVVATSVPQFVAARGELSKSGENYRALARVAADADQLVYVDPLARSVSLAYPGVVRGEDLLLETGPLEGGTIWGENLGLEAIDGLLQPGTVGVFRAAGVEYPVLDAALASNDCSPAGAEVPGSRYRLTIYTCAAE